MKLIDKDALVMEIKRLKDRAHELYGCSQFDTAYDNVLKSINTLKVKEVDNKLEGIEKEVAEGFVKIIDKKRIPISLKGEKKAKFKNEFNTLWQTIDCVQFANVAKHIIERLCLHFAAWGVYNLKGIGQINEEDKKKMDIEEKEDQYENSELKAHAEEYSFNIESELFMQLTPEQQKLWRKEIEQAVISGGNWKNKGK